MSLIEYLDRTGKHVSRKTFEKYKNENHSYSDWEALLIYETYRFTEETNRRRLSCIHK